MNDDLRCCRCARLKLSERHRCPPQWTCAEASVRYDECERAKVYAQDPEEAAEIFARQWWDEESPTDGERLDVAVWVDGEPRPFTVYASYSIDYTAREAKGWPS